MLKSSGKAGLLRRAFLALLVTPVGAVPAAPTSDIAPSGRLLHNEDGGGANSSHVVPNEQDSPGDQTRT